MYEKEVKMKLSSQEIMVLVYIALGYDDKEVAEKMKLSYYTVRTYIDRATLKLAARNKINAVFKCMLQANPKEFMQILHDSKEVL